MEDGNLNMLPSFSNQNMSYCSQINAIFFSEEGLLSMSSAKFSSYFKNIRFIKNAIGIFLSWFWLGRLSSHVASFFRGTIQRIIFICTNKKMIGVYARWIVTFMTNNKTIGNFAKCEHIRNSMCFGCFSVKLKMPVSFSIFCSSPKPTIFSLFNFIPKSIHDGYSSKIMGDVK